MHQRREQIVEGRLPVRNAQVVRSTRVDTLDRGPVHISASLVGRSTEPGRRSTRLEAAGVRQAQRLFGNQAAQRVVQRFVSQSAGKAPAASPRNRFHVPRRMPEAQHEMVLGAPRNVDADLFSDYGGAPEAPKGLIGPPSDESEMPAGAPAKDEAAPATKTTGQIPGGPESSIKAVAVAQAQLINSDSLRSEAQISRIATAHRQQISGQFGSVRRGLSALFAQSTAAIRGFLANKQAEIRGASAGLLKSAQALVASTVQMAQTQANQARGTINGFVAGVTASLQGKVQEIASQIGGVINRVPIPDIPGVAQLRAAAAGLVGSAASAVTGGLAQVRSLIDSALQAGIQLITSVLTDLGQVANTALARVTAGIQRGAQAVLQSLGQIASRIISALRTVVSGTIAPMVNRLEGKTLRALGTAQQQAVSAIRDNRDQHLQALTGALSPRAGGATGGANGSAKAASDGDPAAALQAIAQEAMQNNGLIVQTFDERTTGILGSIFQALTAGAARIAQQIGSNIAEATRTVLAKVHEVLRALGELVGAVGSFVTSLLQDLGGALAGAVQSVRALVQNPVDQLLQFAQGALGRITQFAGRFVGNLLSGNLTMPTVADVIGVFNPTPLRGPITKPRPPGGPITAPGLGRLFAILFVVGALVLSAVPALVVVVEALMALGLGPVAALIVFGALVILALILLLLLLYLLYRLLKPSPKPPPPEKITSLTIFEQPGARTRTTIGVGEQVFLTHSPGSATWTTTAGTVSPGTGVMVIFTAPDTAQTVTVTGGAATIAFTVIAPANVHMDRFAGTGVGHTKDLPDSGIRTLAFLLPDTVNFGNVIYREMDVPGVGTGVYACNPAKNGHCGAGGGGAPCPDLFATDTVIAGKGTKGDPLGDCAYSGHCGTSPPFNPPYAPGSVTIDIPYQYKVKLGGGAYHPFPKPVSQMHTLAADASTLTSDKAGAHGDTTVAAGTVKIPGCPP